MEVPGEAEATAADPHQEEAIVVGPQEEVAVAQEEAEEEEEEDKSLNKIRNAWLFDGQIRSAHLSYADVGTVSFFK